MYNSPLWILGACNTLILNMSSFAFTYIASLCWLANLIIDFSYLNTLSYTADKTCCR